MRVGSGHALITPLKRRGNARTYFIVYPNVISNSVLHQATNFRRESVWVTSGLVQAKFFFPNSGMSHQLVPPCSKVPSPLTAVFLDHLLFCVLSHCLPYRPGMLLNAQRHTQRTFHSKHGPPFVLSQWVCALCRHFKHRSAADSVIVKARFTRGVAFALV